MNSPSLFPTQKFACPCCSWSSWQTGHVQRWGRSLFMKFMTGRACSAMGQVPVVHEAHDRQGMFSDRTGGWVTPELVGTQSTRLVAGSNWDRSYPYAKKVAILSTGHGWQPGTHCTPVYQEEARMTAEHASITANHNERAHRGQEFNWHQGQGVNVWRNDPLWRR